MIDFKKIESFEELDDDTSEEVGCYASSQGMFDEGCCEQELVPSTKTDSDISDAKSSEDFLGLLAVVLLTPIVVATIADACGIIKKSIDRSKINKCLEKLKESDKELFKYYTDEVTKFVVDFNMKLGNVYKKIAAQKDVQYCINFIDENGIYLNKKYATQFNKQYCVSELKKYMASRQYEFIQMLLKFCIANKSMACEFGNNTTLAVAGCIDNGYKMTEDIADLVDAAWRQEFDLDSHYSCEFKLAGRTVKMTYQTAIFGDSNELSSYAQFDMVPNE